MERSTLPINGHDKKLSLLGTSTGGHIRGCIKKFKNRRRCDNSRDTTEGNYYESLNCNPFGNSGVHQKKKAFLCGVSYQKQEYRLQGTTNDVKRMRKMLIDTFGFPKEAILVLTELEQEQYIPTKKNIREAFRWLVKDMQPGDSLVFYYSGHGIRQLDFSDDETDGLNECLCPVDFKENGIILDNEINDTIVRPLVKGVRLHPIVDSCHSGTILDLSHIYDIKRDAWRTDYPPSGVYKGTKGGLAICISACLDSQYAADTDAFSGAKEMTGAMTYTLVDAVNKRPAAELTYYELHNTICKAIDKASDPAQSCNHLLANVLYFKPRIRQDPQLSASHRFDIHKEKFQL